MELLVNELSFHAQFSDLVSFRDAIVRVMAIRQIARRFGIVLYCHRSIAQAQVTPIVKMPQAVQALTINEQRAIMQWLTQHGPFWEDVRNHGPDDWLEWNGNIVTDTAVGEAAWCCLNVIERGLVSLKPSNWQFSPVLVNWRSENSGIRSVNVLNHWDSVAIEGWLQAVPPPMDSWGQLESLARAHCSQLTFAVDAFAPLNGHPFVIGAAQRLFFALNILNRFKSCFNSNGKRTPEGHEIYQNFFTGKKEGSGRGALFSDSSKDEKKRFKEDMTFRHPEDESETLFCTWHGKVQTPQLRVHFSWPVRAEEPLYIVYVGPKITKH